jgi:uncharacterized protein (TIGR02145 family)
VKIPQGFDGDFASLSNIPPDLADGDDNTQLTEAEVDAYAQNNGYLTEEVDGSVTNELQFLSMSNDTIFLTNGGFVKLPAGFDGDFHALSNIPPGLADGDDNTHLSETEVDAYVSNNGYLTAEVDGSVTNELQVLSISNDTIYLSEGGFAKLPAAFTGNYEDLSNKPDLSQYLTEEQDGSATNEIQSLSVSAHGDTLYLSQSNYIIIPGVSNFNLPGVSDIDGNTYGIVRIGTQVWMSENLKTTRFSNGDPIPTTTPPNADISSEINPIYQWPANGDEVNVPEYGRLYTGFVATDPRNVCPAGWHVPTYADWNGLFNYLGGTSEAGGPLKEVGTTHWQNPNSGATNASGFIARGAGYRHTSSFFNLLQRGYFWSSTEYSPGHGLQYYLYHGAAAVGGVANDSYYKGFSIRCIQD